MSDSYLAQRKAAADARQSQQGNKGGFNEKQQHERLQALCVFHPAVGIRCDMRFLLLQQTTM